MFIMSDSLSSAPQRCAVCFCKGCEWVCVGAGAVGGEQTCSSLKMKGEGAFTVSDIYAKCEDVCVYRKEKLTSDPRTHS